MWRGGLVPDQAAGARVLIVDGVTDTGCLATQLAALWGAATTVVCPARAAPLARALGAHTVLADNEGEVELLVAVDRAGPYDLVVECGELLSAVRLSSLLAPKGRHTSARPGTIPSDGWGRLRAFLLPTWRALVTAPRLARPSRTAEPLRYVSRVVQAGQVQPVLDQVVGPAEVGPALTRLATQETVGKSVVAFDRL